MGEEAQCQGSGWRERAGLIGALLWLAVLPIGAALDAAGRDQVVVPVLVLVGFMLAGAGAVLTRMRGLRLVPEVCLGLLAVLTVSSSLAYGREWMSLWLVLAIVSGAVVRGLAGPLAVAAVTLAAALTVWQFENSWEETWTHALSVFLAGISTYVLVRLLGTIEELNRAREELARRAVSEERERFSRDLHDILGHTLSLVVVKAEAARRLVARDQQATAQHALDIEVIGRQALAEVRQAVDGYRNASLDGEIARARVALEAAGIEAEFPAHRATLPARVDETFAWVVREGVTNVVRHSRAAHCRVRLHETNDAVALELTDDGRGADGVASTRPGGLDGLRERLALADGELTTMRSKDGFTLVATVPTNAGGGVS